MILMAIDDDPDSYDQRPSGGGYFTKKDLRNILIVFALILLALWPVYRWFKGYTDDTVCKKNIRIIGSALTQYMELWDDRFPGAYQATPGSDAPLLNDSGAAITWATVISPNIKDPASFTCPAVLPGDEARSVGADGGTLLTGFGLYAPFSYGSRVGIPNPARTVLIAESANAGNEGSYDPLPLAGGQDGFVIGLDDAQGYPTNATRAVTRLAFYRVGNGNFMSDEVHARHRGSIHALSLEGALISLLPESAQYQPGPANYWTPPPERLRGGY
jgi:hypothetical protein